MTSTNIDCIFHAANDARTREYAFASAIKDLEIVDKSMAYSLSGFN